MRKPIKDIKSSNKLNAIRHKVLVFATKFKLKHMHKFESYSYKELTGMLGSLKSHWYKTDEGKKRIASLMKQ